MDHSEKIKQNINIPAYIQHCDCEGFAKENGVTFDSEDLHESNISKCPVCNTPFKLDLDIPVEYEPFVPNQYK
jgi:hypothetical protein